MINKNAAVPPLSLAITCPIQDYRAPCSRNLQDSGALLFGKESDVSAGIDWIIENYGLRNDIESRKLVLRHIIRHELGHMLGLSHPNDTGLGRMMLQPSQYDTVVSSIMYTGDHTFLDDGGLLENFFRASEADIAAVRQLYGPAPDYTFTIANSLGDIHYVKVDVYHGADAHPNPFAGDTILKFYNDGFNKYYKNRAGEQINRVNSQYALESMIQFRKSPYGANTMVLSTFHGVEWVNDPYLTKPEDASSSTPFTAYEDTFGAFAGYNNVAFVVQQFGKSLQLTLSRWADKLSDPIYDSHSFFQDPEGEYDIYIQYDSDNGANGKLDIKFPISGWDEHEILYPGQITSVPFHYAKGHFTSPAKRKELQGYISLNDDSESDDLITGSSYLSYTASSRKHGAPFLDFGGAYFHGTIDDDGVGGTKDNSTYLYVTKDSTNKYKLTIHIKRIR